MAFAQLIGYGVLTLAVWKLVQRRASKKVVNALDVAGPEKEHWWKGQLSWRSVQHIGCSHSSVQATWNQCLWTVSNAA
jgi:hypothetical protein